MEWKFSSVLINKRGDVVLLLHCQARRDRTVGYLGGLGQDSSDYLLVVTSKSEPSGAKSSPPSGTAAAAAAA
jgi:hypothetical protein